MSNNKKDNILKVRLAKFKTTHNTLTNCWLVYESVSKEIQLEKKENKKKLEEAASDLDKVSKLLSNASKLQKTSQTLQERGNEEQAQKTLKRAENMIEEARQYTINEDELPEFQKQLLTSKLPLSINNDLHKKIENYKRIIQKQNKFSSEILSEMEALLPHITNSKEHEELKKLIETKRKELSSIQPI